MKKVLSPKPLYWICQVILLGASILFMAWHLSITPRSGYLTPPFQYILQVLLYWTPFAKIISIISLYFLISSTFWQNRRRIIRVVLFYILDLICSIFSIVVLMPYWINSLFIDSDFMFKMTLFPYALLVGFIIAWRLPVKAKEKRVATPMPPPSVPVTKLPEPDKTPAKRVNTKLVSAKVISIIIILSALTASLLLATNIAQTRFELAGQILVFFPFMLLMSSLYFIPARISQTRAISHSRRVLIVNTLLGWTILGWLVCLVWAYRSKSIIQVNKAPRHWRYWTGWIMGGMVITGIGIGVMAEKTGGGIVLMCLGLLLLTGSYKIYSKQLCFNEASVN